MTADELDTLQRSSYADAMRVLAVAGFLDLKDENGTAIRAQLTASGVRLLEKPIEVALK